MASSYMAAEGMTASKKKMFVSSFELEKALTFPILTNSVAQYKQHLCIYIFRCHEMYKNISHMFV